MKKLTALLLAAAMLLSLTACSLTFLNKGGDTGSSSKDDTSTSGVEPDIPSTTVPDISVPSDDPGPADVSDTPDSLLPDPDKGDDNVTDPPANNDEYTIRISHSDVTLRSEGETFRLSVWDSKGNKPDTCTFTSDDSEIASVDEAGGEVTAVGTGTTNVTAHVKFGDEAKDLTCIVRCSWKTEDDEEGESVPASGENTTAGPSLSSFFSTLQGKYEGLGNMMTLDSSLLDVYYPGLSSVPHVEEVLVQETMISISNVAVALVKFSDDATMDDVTAVQNALQGRINTQADGGAFYPDSCDTWRAGVTTSVSQYVGMFVHPDSAQGMADLFVMTYAN